jgi:hypothetical protein
MGVHNPEADWVTLKVTDLRYNPTSGHMQLVAVDDEDTPTRRVEVAMAPGNVVSDKPV